MNAITLRLPWPPTMNNIYPTGKNGRRYLSQAGKDYAYDVWGSFMLQRPCTFLIDYPFPLKGHLECDIALYPPKKIKGHKFDIDNRIKPILDSLVKAGVMLDDCQVDRITISRREFRERGEAEVLISEAERRQPCTQNA